MEHSDVRRLRELRATLAGYDWTSKHVGAESIPPKVRGKLLARIWVAEIRGRIASGGNH